MVGPVTTADVFQKVDEDACFHGQEAVSGIQQRKAGFLQNSDVGIHLDKGAPGDRLAAIQQWGKGQSFAGNNEIPNDERVIDLHNPCHVEVHLRLARVLTLEEE